MSETTKKPEGGAKTPSPGQIEHALIIELRVAQPLDSEELAQRARDRLGLPPDSVNEGLVNDMLDDMVEEQTLGLLTGDRTVHIDSFLSGITLTHRLTQQELDSGILRADVDFAAFDHFRKLVLDRQIPPIVSVGSPGQLRWEMPDGFGDNHSAGDVVAATVFEDATIRWERLPDPPPQDPELVRKLYRAYEANVAGPELPPYINEVVWEMVADDPEVFAHPRPPLADLCTAAGLEMRGPFVAHAEHLWENLRELQLRGRADYRLGDGTKQFDAALRILELTAQADLDRSEVRAALQDMAALPVAQFVLDEVIPADEPSGKQQQTAGRFADALLGAAGDGTPKAIAHWFAAAVCERTGNLPGAERHLEQATIHTRDWAPALERAAWYASDRGDADRAIAFLRRLPEPNEIAIKILSPFTAESQPDIGRNEPCWCGSGRKFKQCHMGKPASGELPDRVGWLCYKAISYLQHRGGDAASELVRLAGVRAVDEDDPQAFKEALNDPLVADVALCEAGWFERFLRDRSSMLPPDERELGELWVQTVRSVYEVLDVEPGDSIELRDLANDRRLRVNEKTFSAQAKPGMMICARAVPDSRAHQFIGGVFAVQPGTQDTVLQLCADGDPWELCRYVAGLQHAPRR